MSQNETISAVLCGDLNMVRCFSPESLRRAKLDDVRIPFVVASSNPQDTTFSSRYVDKRAVIADPARDPERTASDLIDLAKAIGGRPALFYGNDAMLLCVSRNRQRLAEHYRFLMPPADLIETLVHKSKFATLAKDLLLPIPTTVTSAEVTSARDVLARISLPCALKPASHTGWFSSLAVKQEGGLPRKALFACSESQLEQRIEQLRSFSNEFVIQSYIPGSDENIISFHAWMDTPGHVVASFIGKKIRTYPRGSGESTFVELFEDEQATKLGCDIIRSLGLVGVVKLDFKRHAGTGELFLLEVNPRFNLWHHLGASSGVNLPLMAYATLSGISIAAPGRIETGRKWISVDDDLRAMTLEHRSRGALVWPEWLLSLRGPLVFDAFAWDDPWPATIFWLRQIETRLARQFTKAGKP